MPKIYVKTKTNLAILNIYIIKSLNARFWGPKDHFPYFPSYIMSTRTYERINKIVIPFWGGLSLNQFNKEGKLLVVSRNDNGGYEEMIKHWWLRYGGCVLTGWSKKQIWDKQLPRPGGAFVKQLSGSSWETSSQALKLRLSQATLVRSYHWSRGWSVELLA